MSIYDEMREVMGEVLPEFQQGVINLIQLTPGTGTGDDPGQPIETVTPLVGTATGSIFSFVRNTSYASFGLIPQADLGVTAVPVDGITPTMDDFIQVDGIRYKIIQDLSVPAAGTKVAWKFLLRK